MNLKSVSGRNVDILGEGPPVPYVEAVKGERDGPAPGEYEGPSEHIHGELVVDHPREVVVVVNPNEIVWHSR